MVKFRKIVTKARKGIRKAASTYLKAKRSSVGKYISKRVPNYGFSSTSLVKTIQDLTRKVNASAELKTLDQLHTTPVGTADNTTRYFYRVCASGLLATQYSTTAAGTPGYVLRQFNMPSKGDGAADYDGQKFSVESLQWKGTVALGPSSQGTTQDGSVKMYIVEYRDDDDSAFAINEFLETDNNGEYSTKSRRNRNFWADYKVIASQTLKLSYGSVTRKDFNIFVKPKRIVRHLDSSATTIPIRYMCVLVASPDIADKTTYVDYVGNTRMRFTH